MPEESPEVVQDLIKKLLVRDPAQRLGADDITLLKYHDFFEGVDFDKIYDSAPPLLERQMKLTI